MDAILNNPFRILGLDPTLDEGIISERVSEILMLLTNGNKVTYPLDEFYDRILVDPYNTLQYNDLSNNKGTPIPPRNIETVKIANEKLQDPIKRKYYGLFAFKFDKIFISLDADGIIETLESELNIKEKRINRFSRTAWADFLNHYSETENASYTIEKDYNSLKIKNLIVNGTFLKPTNGFIISQLLNFSWEFDCEWIEGVDNNCFSVFWGKDPLKNSYYSFGVSGNGYFYLSIIEDGRRLDNDQDFVGWKQSDAIKQHDQNHLEVRKNEDSTEFYINNCLVHKINNIRKFYGEDFGLIIFGKQTVVFSNFKINNFRTDIDYAADICIANDNFKKVKNLALIYFSKAFSNRNKPATDTKINTSLVTNRYAPSFIRNNLDKALILFGTFFQQKILISSGFFKENTDSANEYNSLAQNFLADLLKDFHNSFENEYGIKYFWVREKLQEYSKEFVENFYTYCKNRILQIPNSKDEKKYKVDIDLFKKSKISKSHFGGSINNPFRILAIKHNATEKEISKRVSDLLIYTGMGKFPKYSSDLFFGVVDRKPENIKEASKLLENPSQKLYYSLLWFIEENEADKDFLKELHTLDNLFDSEEFKLLQIGRVMYFIEKKIHYTNSVNSISQEKYYAASSRLTRFIDTKTQFEENKFCLYDDIISALPINYNCNKTENNLIVNSNTEEGILVIKNIYFDNENDYEIEIDCEWIEGVDYGKLYGIVFCKDAGNNFYRFGISAYGSYYFDAVVDGEIQNICGWHYCKAINLKAKNNLKVYYSNQSKEFWIEINGSRPLEFAAIGIKALEKKLLGNYIGVSVFGKQKISFSNFKISYKHYVRKTDLTQKIRSSNITSAINVIASKLCLCSLIDEQYNNMESTISLFGIVLNSDYLPKFASKIVGVHTNFDISTIERYFIDDIYNFVRPQLDKNERAQTKEFIEAFHSFSEANQKYILHRFIGRPILDIEDSIAKTKIFLKNTPLQGVILGFNLFNTTNENLFAVRKILSYTNYQYRLLANDLADTILDCGIIYFNAIRKNRDTQISEVNQIFKLINHANTIAIDGDARKRVNENMDFTEKWIANMLKKEQELKGFKNNAPIYHPTNILINAPKLDKKNIQRSVNIVRNTFIIVLLASAIIYAIVTDKSQDALQSTNSRTNLSKPALKNTEIYSRPQEVSRWKGNVLQNGVSPYDSFFGKGIYNYNSKCWITFKNGNSTDAIVCLENASNGRTIRNEYIQAGTDYTMSNLPAGVYKVKAFYGNDWNPEKTLNGGLITGAFDTDFSFSLSDDSKDWVNMTITKTREGISYSTGEITLYMVSNGNMNQRKINSDEFFK